MSLVAICPLHFLTPNDLQTITGRSISASRSDLNFFKDLFGLRHKERLPGIPLHLYAQYYEVEPEMILEKLKRKKV